MLGIAVEADQHARFASSNGQQVLVDGSYELLFARERDVMPGSPA